MLLRIDQKFLIISETEFQNAYKHIFSKPLKEHKKK